MSIRVVVVDDETLVRSAVATLLGLEEDLEIVAEAASGTEGVAVIARHTPDIAVLDLQMPDLDGIEVPPRSNRPNPMDEPGYWD